MYKFGDYTFLLSVDWRSVLLICHLGTIVGVYRESGTTPADVSPGRLGLGQEQTLSSKTRRQHDIRHHSKDILSF